MVEGYEIYRENFFVTGTTAMRTTRDYNEDEVSLEN